MKYKLLPAIVFLILMSSGVFAQPLPCPVLTTTWIQGLGDTTVCNGACTPIGCIDSTSAKSTSSYTYSTIPYLPTSYTGGTPIIVGIDDVWSDSISLPFEFCFYGTKYTSLQIGSNGEVGFTYQTPLVPGGCDWEIGGPWPASETDATGTQNCILGVYEDIDPNWGGLINWAVYGSAPCRTFVVSYNNVPFYNTGAGLCVPDTATSQIVLYESTYAIDIFVKHKPTCSAWNGGLAMIGIIDASGSNYNLPYNATVFTADNQGYRFTPNAPATWTYKWTDNTGAVVGTSQYITVCPTDSMTYTVRGLASTNCDTFPVYSSVFVNVGKDPTVDNIITTNPSLCNRNDGSILLHGLVPGISDTVYYKFNGVLQPYYVQTSTIDSTLTLSGLCQGVYDSITVEVGMCHTPPYSAILTPPPLNIGPLGTTNPSFCGLCDGTVTIYGLAAGQPYGLNYTYTATSPAAPPVAEPPYIFTASPDGSVTLTGLCAGIYDGFSATLTSGTCGNTCVTPVIGPVTLKIPDTPHVNIIVSTGDTTCGGISGTILLRNVTPYSEDTISYFYNGAPATPFVTVAASDSSILLTGLNTGTYSGIIVKYGACIVDVPAATFIDSVTIKAAFDTAVHLGCHGDTVFLNNSSSSYHNGVAVDPEPLYYIWSFGDGSSDTSANPYHVFATQGVYTISLVTDNHHCVDTSTIVVPLLHPLFDSFTAATYLACQDSAIQFTNNSFGTAGLPVYYQWSFGDGATSTLTNVAHTYAYSGAYTVQLIAHDYIPCYDTFAANVTIDTLSGITMLSTDTIICQGTGITFTSLYSSIGNLGVVWNFGDGDNLKNINPVIYSFDATGTFTVVSTAVYRACDNITTSRVVNIVPTPAIYLGPDTSLCEGSGIINLYDRLNETNPLATWLWSTGATTPSIPVSMHGWYWATVNINNCYASDSVLIANDCYVDAPNAFSPNGDGVNDYFLPRQYLTKGVTAFKMDIYNRWGQLIFETTTLDGSGWDGKFNGVPQLEGVYIFLFDATFKDGQREHHQGNFTLLR